jgi:multidrug efflux pump subunit AcrA (membrane-fusion protein)
MLVGLLVFLWAGLAHAEDKTQGSNPPETSTMVLVATATKLCFSKVVNVTGFLVPKQPAIVTLDLDGFQVAEIFANAGDRVTIGQPLVRIARIATDAPQTGAASQSVGQSSILLRAPAGGLILKSRADIGTVASSQGDPLFQIAVDGVIEVDAEVPGLYVAEIAEGQAARITLDQGQVSGRVRLVGGEIDPLSHMMHVRLQAAPDLPLLVGAFVKASIDTRHSCGIAVPLSAVQHSSDGVSVQVVRGRIVETHRVRLGLHSDHDVEIAEGLQLGDLVVAYAGSSLRDGDEVTTRSAETPSLPQDQMRQR